MADHHYDRTKLADYAVGALRGRARRAVEAHLERCAKCRAELAALERTGALLDALRPAEAPQATWEAARQEIAERRRAPRARPRLAWAAVTAAAVALIVVGVIFLLPLVGEPPVVVTAEADSEMQATIEDHLSSVWAAPLADEAAVGLRLAAWEDDG